MSGLDFGAALGDAITAGYGAFQNDRQQKDRDAQEIKLAQMRADLEKMLAQVRVDADAKRAALEQHQDTAKEVASTLSPWQDVTPDTDAALAGTPYAGRVQRGKTLPSSRAVAPTAGGYGDAAPPDLSANSGGDPWAVWQPTAKEQQQAQKDRARDAFVGGLSGPQRKAVQGRELGVNLDPSDYMTPEERSGQRRVDKLEDLEMFKQRTDLETAAHKTRRDYDVAHPTSSAGTGSGDVDAPAIADAIMRGEQPPDTSGLYRYGASVRSALAKKGYNLAQATEDWKATQKYLQTLNGPQQVRLRQAVDFTAESLGVVRDLVDQWDSGRFPVLNKAQLAAAKGGALGKNAQKIAVQLDAQIGDLVSELGTVYKGGNSSTDESLALAAKNLQSNWSKDTALSAIDLIERNLAIRRNSMKTASVAGTGRANAYAPDQGELEDTSTTRQKSGGSGGQTPKSPARKVGDRVTLKDGRTGRIIAVTADGKYQVQAD